MYNVALVMMQHRLLNLCCYVDSHTFSGPQCALGLCVPSCLSGFDHLQTIESQITITTTTTNGVVLPNLQNHLAYHIVEAKKG